MKSREELISAMRHIEPREYRLDVRLPRDLSEKITKMVQGFRKEGVGATKSKVVVVILRQFFDSLPEE